jgi:hypothetical protein
MPRSVDFKRLNLSHSEQAMIKKWSRVMVAIYASFAVVAVVTALATSGLPRLDNVAAQQGPTFVSFDHN